MVPRDRLALFCIVIGTYLYVRVWANVLIIHIVLAGVRLCVIPCLLLLPRNVQNCRGVGMTGALAPAMWKPWGREYLITPAIFSHTFACCSLNFHSLSLCCLHTIKMSHSVGTTGRILRNKLTKHTSPARISINKNSANA